MIARFPFIAKRNEELVAVRKRLRLARRLASGCLFLLSVGSANVQALENDDFADRIDLGSSLPAAAAGSNVNATLEAGEPYPVASEASVWWTWQAPGDGWFEVNTFGSDFNTRLGIYSGTTLSGLTLIAENANAAGGIQSKAVFMATAGMPLQIQVLGYKYSETNGSVSLQIKEAVLPRFVLSSEVEFPDSRYSFSGHLFTDGSTGRITDSAIAEWEITVRTPGDADGTMNQVLTRSNSTVEFLRKTSVGTLDVEDGQIIISGASSLSPDLRSSLTFSSGDISLIFFGGDSHDNPAIELHDESENPTSSTFIIPGASNAGITVAVESEIDQPVDAPSIEIRRDENGSGIIVTFSGILQRSTDLLNWTDFDPQPTSPYSFAPGAERGFFRTRAEPSQ